MIRAMRIAPLTADAAPRYRALMLGAYRDEPDAFVATVEERAALPDGWWVERIADPSGRRAGFGAFADGRLVGAVAMEHSARPKTAHAAVLIGLYVQPAHRGRGAGRALVEAVAERCAERGVRVLTLTVIDGNEAARRLYAAAGFERFGVEPMAVRTAAGLRARIHLWRAIPSA